MISVTLRQFRHCRSLYAPTNLLLFFFLSEIKSCKCDHIASVCNSLGFPSFYFVPSVGKSGGLLLM